MNTSAAAILTAISSYTRDAKVRILALLGAEQRMQEYFADRNERRYSQAKEEFMQLCNTYPQAIVAAATDIASLGYEGDYSRLLMEV